jgi:protein O-mannosyl-transferase
VNAKLSGTSEEDQLRPHLCQRDWLWALFLIAFVFIAYARVFNAGFIWDDESHLTRNPCIVGPLGLKEVWTSARAVYYPLVLTTFWTVHKFVGLSPWPYHFFNVLLHAGSAVLLWQVLRQLNVRGAWLGAALWGLHPVMVQSVAWVTELKNTQSGFFYLLSIFWFLKWAPYKSARISSPLPSQGRGQGEAFDVESETPIAHPLTSILSPLPRGEAERAANTELKSRGRVHWWNFGLSLLFFLLAVLSKPSVVMLPVVIALCIWWRTGRLYWRDVAALAPFVLISALASVWTILEQKFHAGAIGAEWAQTWPERLIIAGRAIWFYVAKLAWPYPLIFIYPRWEINSSQLMAYLPLVAALAGLLALLLVRTNWSRAALFAAAYYVVSLFPVLGFFSVYFFRYSFVSDHFQYLASMGPLALAGAGIVTAVGRFGETPSRLASDTGALQFSGDIAVVRPKSVLLPATSGILLLALVFLTWRQTAVYHNLVTLYTATLTKNPGCWMAHYNLGIALNDQGDADGAIAHYRQAVELRPSYAEARYNLGRLLAQKGQLDEAIVHYEKALEINPADAEAHNNLGATLFAKGHVDEAIAHYRKALVIQPDYADASCNLASALLSNGDLDGAIAYYSACLAILPNQAEAQYNLASALFQTGRMDEAIAHYRKVLELRPESTDARANLGSVFLAKGRVRDAIAQYKDVLRIAPDNVAAQSNLAWVLATAADPSLRNGSEAVLLAERAESESSRSENHAIVLRILAAAYAETGRFVEAKKTAEQALQAAETHGNSTLSNALQDEISLYELGLPYHKEAK